LSLATPLVVTNSRPEFLEGVLVDFQIRKKFSVISTVPNPDTGGLFEARLGDMGGNKARLVLRT